MLRRRALLVRSVGSIGAIGAIGAISPIGALTICLLAAPASAQQEGNLRAADHRAGTAWEALRAGAIVVFRHADAPGGGDPPGLKLDDCSTQRNLSAEGRAQARRIGERLRQERVAVGAVWASQWCRTRETAELLGSGPVRDAVAFNSFFGEREREAAQTRQTAAARAALLGWRGPVSLVVVTHQVNLTALTGIFPAQGEGVVLRPRAGQLEVVGRVLP